MDTYEQLINAIYALRDEAILASSKASASAKNKGTSKEVVFRRVEANHLELAITKARSVLETLEQLGETNAHALASLSAQQE